MNADDLFPVLAEFYRGFHIAEPAGNNAFSFAHRKNQRIYVAPVARGAVADLAVGTQPAFSEVVGGRELNTPGLQNFIHCRRDGRELFIFDNHNHAFFFWLAALKAGKLNRELPLVHVDQHTDLRDPPAYLKLEVCSGLGGLDLPAVFDYTNYTLNVGNFIKPAMQLRLFSSLEIIAGREALKKTFDGEIVLDIDIDFFATEMSYIPDDVKFEALGRYIRQAKLITVATSPYFMDQSRAIEIVKKLFA